MKRGRTNLGVLLRLVAWKRQGVIQIEEREGGMREERGTHR